MDLRWVCNIHVYATRYYIKNPTGVLRTRHFIFIWDIFVMLLRSLISKGLFLDIRCHVRPRVDYYYGLIWKHEIWSRPNRQAAQGLWCYTKMCLILLNDNGIFHSIFLYNVVQLFINYVGPLLYSLSIISWLSGHRRQIRRYWIPIRIELGSTPVFLN